MSLIAFLWRSLISRKKKINLIKLCKQQSLGKIRKPNVYKRRPMLQKPLLMLAVERMDDRLLALLAKASKQEISLGER